MAAERRTFFTILGAAGLLAASGVAASVLCHKAIRTEEGKLVELRDEIGKARAKVEAIPEREREAIIARENLDEIAKILPDDTQVEEFVRRLQDFQQETEVGITSLENASPKRQTGKAFHPVAYRINLDGNLWQFLAFLSRLESYERFVRVPRFKVASGPRPKNGDYEAVRHRIQLEVETFAYNRGKGDTKRAQIPHYEKRKAELADEIAKAREKIEVIPYEYRGPHGRRDPMIDPRLPSAAAGGAGLPLDEQSSLLERLRAEVDKIRGEVDRFRTTGNLIERAELRRAISTKLGALAEEVGKTEREGKIAYLPLARRFRREVVEGISEARRAFEAVMAEGPTAEELKAVARAMRDALAAGDLPAALDRYALVAERLRSAEGDPTRAPLAAEIRELERRARLAEEFSRLKIVISGVVVRPDGAVAVINGRTVTEGDMLDDDLFVRRIGVEEIEFQYRDLVIARKR
ncbi:MAG TPA: type 4a pilus biogenesis protein PilO [Planctomycetota bacterium]|jgi:Tfp pilus assembly protein PilO|nr:type 4a pilus biogenesis protein PilO [Planctomycetota bacterium]